MINFHSKKSHHLKRSKHNVRIPILTQHSAIPASLNYCASAGEPFVGAFYQASEDLLIIKILYLTYVGYMLIFIFLLFNIFK